MLTTRRRVLMAAAGAAAAQITAGRIAPAQTATPAPSPTPAASGTAAPASPELTALARARFGKYLSPEELRMLDEELATLERRSARLRGILLANREEPATDFRVVR